MGPQTHDHNSVKSVKIWQNYGDEALAPFFGPPCMKFSVHCYYLHELLIYTGWLYKKLYIFKHTISLEPFKMKQISPKCTLCLN